MSTATHDTTTIITRYKVSNKIKSKERRVNGKLHSIDVPARETWHTNGQLKTQEYWVDNGLHNDQNIPAFREWDRTGRLIREEYWINDNRHNEIAPAVQVWDTDGQLKYAHYYINGERLALEQFNNHNSA